MTLAGSLASPARAEDVALDMTGCAQPSPSDVRAVLEVELQGQLRREDEAGPRGAQVVEVRCTSSDAHLWLRGTNARRTVTLTTVPPELRARLLALSVAELTRPHLTRPARAHPQPTAAGTTVGIATSDPTATSAAAAAGEAGASSDEAARAADAPRSNDATDEADATSDGESADQRDEGSEAYDSNAADLRPPPAYFAWLGAEAQASPLFSVGGSLAFQAIVSEWLAWSSAFSVAHAAASIDRGDLSVLSLSLRTGLALVLRSQHGSLHVGAGLRGQWQRLEGEPSDAELTRSSSFSAWSLGPAAFGGATWQFASPAFLALELEAARLREVRAQVEAGDAKTLSAWRASAVVGMGLAW